MAFVFYDLETTGTHRHFDQVLQFAAIKTDPDLNEIERVNLRCRLLPHVIPSPTALAITRVGLDQLLDRTLPTHYEMICEIVRLFERWSPAVFLGWNTLDFDEEFLRQAFYQCLHSPYYTNTNGNARTDLLRFCQALTMLQPGVLNLPEADDGSPTLALEVVAPANGFPNFAAHDALADVEAMVHLCGLVQQRTPELWSDALRFCPKASAISFMREEPAFLVTECYFGRPYRYALTMIGIDPANASSVLAYDLDVDPASLRTLSDEALVWRLNERVKPVRRVKANKSPLLADIWSVDAFHEVTPDVLVARSEEIQADVDLKQRLIAAAERAPFGPSPYVEAQIYDGFFCDDDQSTMRQFHQVGWDERARIVEGFKDPRLTQLGRRLVYQHAPEHIHPNLRERLAQSIARRMLGQGVEAPWLTLGAASDELQQRLKTCDPIQRSLLTAYEAHLSQELKRCQAACGQPQSLV